MNHTQKPQAKQRANRNRKVPGNLNASALNKLPWKRVKRAKKSTLANRK